MLVNVKKSTKRGSDGDLAASPTKKIHDNIETANEEGKIYMFPKKPTDTSLKRKSEKQVHFTSL